ncbi:MAG TPA: bifunctional riboflavin kinase/FAD synthetase [Rhodospirillaceae bacterium]|nr:bifunctional riboflavin kinase/FAD synthetase [Rhodospirillaceae bacterium]
MRIFRHFTELPAAIRGGVLALGNFDGVHLGHQNILNTTVKTARRLGVAAGAMTFEPHPRTVFNPDKPPFRLTPFRVKARLIESLGLDFLLMQHFDLAFAAHTAEQFTDDILGEALGAVQIVVGYDFAFGHGRKGNGAMLQTRGVQKGFSVQIIDPLRAEDGSLYSSSRVREMLAQGNPRQAAQLLGRDWEIEGRVELGDQRGRQLGFPTANLHMADFLLPAFGVYAVRAGIDKGEATQWLPGVANFGQRPTFGKEDRVLEVHLFDFDGDLYGRHLRVALADFLRGEQKFDGPAALKVQIEQDCVAARRALAF